MDFLEWSEIDIDRFVADLWYPFAQEMATVDPLNELTEDATEHARRYFEDEVDSTDTAGYVVDIGDELVAYMVISEQTSPPIFTRGDTAHIDQLYVDPAFRGEGIGTALIERAESWANNRNCEGLTLSVDVTNEDARAFYDRVGFRERRLKLQKRLG